MNSISTITSISNFILLIYFFNYLINKKIDLNFIMRCSYIFIYSHTSFNNFSYHHAISFKICL